MMTTVRSAIYATLLVGGLSAPASAGLTLVAGPNQGTYATNNYGYTGTYYDLRGPGGTSQEVSHPGGGPVAFLYVFGNGGIVSTYYDSTAGPYDGNDDTQVAVLNLSSKTLGDFVLASSSTGIYGFDGDGIDSFGAASNSKDSTGYGGADTYFTSINGAQTSGTVNFVTPLAAGGGVTFFSLEAAPSLLGMGTVVPEPSSLVMAGLGASLVLGYSRRVRASARR